MEISDLEAARSLISIDAFWLYLLRLPLRLLLLKPEQLLFKLYDLLLQLLFIPLRPLRLMSDSLDTFRPPHEVIEERTKQRCEENNQRPGNLVIALRRFLGNTINKYPDPENCCEDSNAIKPS